MLEINGKNLCEHCFSQIPAGHTQCPVCTKEKNNSKYPTALPEGTILAGRYVVGRVLGKGGFGITYLCYDSRDGKKVAVKEYLPDAFSHRNTGETIVSTYGGESEDYFKKGAQNFFEEAKLVSNFNGNPNIISVYEFFYENNTTYFVMEYLEGVDFKTYIESKGGKISEDEALFVAEKVVQALMIVHSLNVLHRDISPDNIFICNDLTVKLIDFGAARQAVGETSKSLSVILKQGFAPIEQYQTRGKQGPWTDIYALGATLYFALTGNRLDDAMSRLTEEKALDFSGISYDFAKIINKMIAVRKEDRYQNTFILSGELSNLRKKRLTEQKRKSEMTEGDKSKVEIVKKINTQVKTHIDNIQEKNNNIQGENTKKPKGKKKTLIIVISVIAALFLITLTVALVDYNTSNPYEPSYDDLTAEEISIAEFPDFEEFADGAVTLVSVDESNENVIEHKYSFKSYFNSDDTKRLAGEYADLVDDYYDFSMVNNYNDYDYEFVYTGDAEVDDYYLVYDEDSRSQDIHFDINVFSKDGEWFVNIRYGTGLEPVTPEYTYYGLGYIE